MARHLNEDVIKTVKELINHLSGLQDGSDSFRKIEKNVQTQLIKADTMCFVNQKDMDQAVASMAEKFQFHGFFSQAEHLQKAYRKYMSKTSSQDLNTRLNIIKFLLCMSDSPIKKFEENPDEYLIHVESEEEEDLIDWGAYLKEGIEIYAPALTDDASDWSDQSEDESVHAEKVTPQPQDVHKPIITSSSMDLVTDCRIVTQDELRSRVQHTWFNEKYICMRPPSQWREANFGLQWENFLEGQVQGLVAVQKASVISEYKFMREIIWQMWGPHSSFVFKLKGNNVEPRNNTTIASVRSIAIDSFLLIFVNYMELIEYFRDFFRSLNGNAPQTYRSYADSIYTNFIYPLQMKLVNIEDTVREQETTYTLLKLAKEFEQIFEPLQVVKNIHQALIGNFNEKPTLYCTVKLLCHLHDSLKYSLNKLEQDIKLCLYFETLYQYLKTVDRWLTKNDFGNHDSEFVIIRSTSSVNEGQFQNIADLGHTSEMGYTIAKDFENECTTNGIIDVICDRVLQIGRNIQLLTMLGKFDFHTTSKETIQEELIRRCLEELCLFYGYEGDDIFEDIVNEEIESENKINSACIDITDFVDKTNDFLVLAFEGFMINRRPIELKKKSKLTLFDKISKITTEFNLFPVRDFIEKNFVAILKERFTVSGLMVKNVLVEEYHIDKHFEFLRAIFLFSNDLLYPFYKRFFSKMNVLGSDQWKCILLTSHLQDILMDLYPEFSDKCTVNLSQSAGIPTEEPLQICDGMDMEFVLNWPLTIVITKTQIDMYKELFHFFLKIKWAMYMLSHLHFADLNRNEEEKKSRIFAATCRKLEVFRMCLLKILITLEHYVFGFVYHKCLKKFELDFEKSSDLTDIIRSHSEFINCVYQMVKDLEHHEVRKCGLNTIWRCVKMLKTMWENIDLVTTENLNNYFKLYKYSYNIIDTKINQVY